MKKSALILIILFSLLSVSAQTNAWQQTETYPNFYLGIQSGLESFTGLIGVTGDFRLKNNLFIRAGAGIGSWGWKISAGIRNEKSSGKGIGYGIYISNATGLKDFTTELETTTGKKDVNLDLQPGMTLNPVISYKWLINNKNRFFLEGGYAVPLQNLPYKIRDGSILTDTSKRVMKTLCPGGLSLGLGFQFAL
jgi:hypothetical protein